jgi:cytochrome c553
MKAPDGEEKTSSGSPAYSTVAKMLKAFRGAARGNDKQAVMRGIAKDLGDQDIEALAAYIAAMR